MNVFGRSKGGGRRSAQRVPAPVLAVLSTVTEDHRGALVNISSTGARLSAPSLPREGEQVIFKADRVTAFGRFVWSKGAQCGIAFDGPIIADELERLRRQVSMWSRVGMSPDDQIAAQEWQLGISR
jgi:hypothetical protein